MIYEESIWKIRLKNVNIVRVIIDLELFFNFKYRTLFRSDNYLGIISGSAWKKTGIISGLGSFRGRFEDHFWVGDHFGGCTGAEIQSYRAVD